MGVRGILALVVGAASLVLVAPASALVDASFADGVLTITGDGESDGINVSCVDDEVVVAGATVGDPIACPDVTSIIIDMGDGDDVIDLDEVTTEAFIGLTDIAIDAGDGDDTTIASPLAEDVDGGVGDDRLMVAGTDWDDDFRVTASQVTDRVSGITDTIAGLERFEFRLGAGSNRIDASSGAGRYELFGNDGVDILIGGPLDDFLDGGDGDDRLEGGAGVDVVQAGGGADAIVLAGGNDAVDGNDGSDRYTVSFGAMNAVVEDTGASGTDVLTVTNLCSTVTITATAVSRGADSLAYSGIDSAVTCTADPPPPAPPQPPPPAEPTPPPPSPPPAAAPPPPAALPPAPPRTPATKKPVKITVCHKGKTKKVTKAQLKKLRGAKRGACKPKKKTTTRR